MPQLANRRAFHNFDIFFRSINPVLDKGQEPGHKFSNEDAYEAPPEDMPTKGTQSLKRAWKSQLESSDGSLFKAIIRSDPGVLGASMIFHFFEISIQFVSPIMINNLVQFIDSSGQNMSEGLLCAVVFVMCPVLQSLCQSHFIVHCRRLGIRTQGATACMVFDKCLRLSQPAAASYGAGALVNIMQVDTVRFDFAFFHANFMWSMPYMLIVGVTLLYMQLGVAAFTPLVVMAIMHPFNNVIVKRLMKVSREVNQRRDSRVKLLTEVVHALKLVKMLAWEDKIYHMVENKRAEEMASVRVFKLWGVFNGFVWQGMPILLPVLTFAVYVLLGGKLYPGVVFSSLALLDLVRIPMTLFPQALQVLVQVYVGLNRIEKLLRAEDVEQQVAPVSEYICCHSCEAPMAIRVAQAEFAWAEASRDEDGDEPDDNEGKRKCCSIMQRWRARRECRERPPTAAPLLGVSVGLESAISLSRVSGASSTHASAMETSHANMTLAMRVPASAPALEIPRGKLIFICGSVGAGKSTLIAGLLNEVPLLAGFVKIQGPIAYCSQVPWIQHGTVKDNITFGDEYDSDLFAQVVQACAIGPDLEELRDGAETVIGERGINLSGGQKARISLARAAYRHRSASTFLLDDPLSAVDAHVAKHLVQECLGSDSGLLRHSTRILVTHQLQYMKEADLVVVLKNGELVTCREPHNFSAQELEDYGLQVHQGTPPAEVSALDNTSTLGSTSEASGCPSPLPLQRALSNTSAPGALMLERALSNTSESAALSLEVGSGLVAALNEECSPSHSQFRLGHSKLLPHQPGSTAHHLVRSLSEGPAGVGAPHPLLAMRRAVSSPTKSSAEKIGEGSIEASRGITSGNESTDERGPESVAQAMESETRHENIAQAPAAQHDEESDSGGLSVQVWCTYAKTMGPCLSGLLVTTFCVANLMQMASTFWLADWSESLLHKSPLSRHALAASPGEAFLASFGSLGNQADKDAHTGDVFYRLAVYTVLSVLGVVCLIARMFIFLRVSLQVSRELHKHALWCVMRSPTSWLDTTPTGRILNRFSQDMQKLDMELTGTVGGFVDCFVNLIISITVIFAFVPPLFLVVLPLGYVYNRVQHRFRETARELQRLTSLSRSPIYQGLDESIVGVSCIRAFGKQEHFSRENTKRCELSLKLTFNIMCCNRWLALRLRTLGTIPVMIVAVGMVIESRLSLSGLALTGARAGIVLRYSLQLVDVMQGLLMNLTMTELSLVALERIRGFTELAQEPALEEEADKDLGVWPIEGDIEFHDVKMRYRADLPRVLNGVSFTIPGGTSVGVVGRTGAGKSSLIQALFHLCPLDGGKICIDGIEVSSLGLHTMRRRLAIIPQDPVGFTGSLRFNLDPFKEHSDDDLWRKLEKVQLEELFKSKADGLDFRLSAGGENLSVGQRQLVCVARALLRGCRILILDEATASIDFQTDELIQQVLRSEVATNKLTTMTIAHRVNTILGSDNVLVMERGVVAEFGPTQYLASDPKTKFYTFVHAADDH